MPTTPRPLLLSVALVVTTGLLSPLAWATGSTKAATVVSEPKSGRSAKTANAGTRRSMQLARADHDGSGTLSRDEVHADAPRLVAHFDAIDANHDGQLSPQEIRAWSRSPARQRGRTALVTHFTRADADGNGLLSRDEADAHLPRIAAKFDRIDGNRDGAITAEEFEEYLMTRRKARSGGQ